jgi:NAD(P)-dependent dehydrogenase (short-subunit alcohol dehydrogenase family)
VNLEGAGTLVAGGASGLGEAAVRALSERRARVAILDINDERGEALAAELGPAGGAVYFHADVTKEDEVEAAVRGAVDAFGEIRFAVASAGVGWAERVAGKNGPAKLDPFELVLKINLVGTYNVLRLASAAMNSNEPDPGGERGAVVMTASIAAFDGQIGQTAYAASKGGIVGLTLPAARDLASRGIRVCTIAPGTFDTPLLAALPQESRDALGQQIPFPSRLGRPEEYADLAIHIAENPMLNGETIRLDGALRMPPR